MKEKTGGVILKRAFQLGLVFALVASLIVPVAILMNKVEAADVVVKEYNFDDGTTQGWGPRGDATLHQQRILLALEPIA